MIIKNLVSPKNLLFRYLSSIQDHYRYKSLKSIKLGGNPCFQFRLTYNISGRKIISKQKEKSQITSKTSKTSTITPIDMSTLSVIQKFRLLKQDIEQSIKSKQDGDRLMDVLQFYTQLYFTHQKFKDGMIELDRIRKLMEANSAFKASPNYHFVLNQLKFFFGILGRYQEAIAINQKSFQLIKKNSQKQSLQVASELATLAVLHFSNKTYSQARKALQNQLKINKEVCDDTFTQMIDCKNNIAIIDFMDGKYQNALKTFQKNAQISTRIMNTNKKGKKQKLYAKHFVYLEGIYQMQMFLSKDPTQKTQLKTKIITCLQNTKQIIKDNQRLLNDFHLYYETIAQQYLQANMYELCIKFINKALSINETKMQQPLVTGKLSKSAFEISNDIAKQLRILAIAYEKQGRYLQAFQIYKKSKIQFQKNILTSEAKQMLNLSSVEDFIDCCKSLFRLKFIIETDGAKAFNEGLNYLEAPLLIWNSMMNNVWNPPQYFTFIPYEINIEIGIKWLQFEEGENALNYFKVCIKEIQSKKQDLCNKSKKQLSELSLKMEIVLKKIQQKHVKEIVEIKQMLVKLKTYCRN